MSMITVSSKRFSYRRLKTRALELDDSGNQGICTWDDVLFIVQFHPGPCARSHIVKAGDRAQAAETRWPAWSVVEVIEKKQP